MIRGRIVYHCLRTISNPHMLHRGARFVRSLESQPASQFLVRNYSATPNTAAQQEETTDEKPSEKREFQAETKMLLDIVAKSLYSEKEVFLRELISNASDALEKLRYAQMNQTPGVPLNTPLEIRVDADRMQKTLTITDTGVGLTKDELISNLGTIARSGSKEFLKQLESSGTNLSMDSIIGQFGVGFYSAFMVAERVEVYTKTHDKDATGYKWTSDGSGSYEISECDIIDENVGTKIVLHLKPTEAHDFTDEMKIQEIIRRYSNFVNCPILLNGTRINTVQALWTLEPKDVSKEQHEDFFRFISHSQNDRPQYTLHYKTDSPINLRAVLYVPGIKPTLFDIAREGDVGVALYSRRILIQPRANSILPRWMRFLKGVVDSEDIPLNLSRELLQQGALITKIRTILSNRLIKFFLDQMKKDPEKYDEFFKDYSLFMKEAIVSSTDQNEKEEVSKLLRFESSNFKPGVQVNFDDYASRMQAGQRDIYYLCAPSRQLAESSPYYEAIREKNQEVLFCYEPYDELMLLQLQQYDRKNLTSVEKSLHVDRSDDILTPELENTRKQTDELLNWIQLTLGSKKVNEIKITSRLSTHPCIVTVADMGAARHFLRSQFTETTQEQRYMLLKPTLEINPKHDIIVSLDGMRRDNPELAELIVNQVYDNAMVAAGLLEDPRTMVSRMNDLLAKLMTQKKLN